MIQDEINERESDYEHTAKLALLVIETCIRLDPIDLLMLTKELIEIQYRACPEQFKEESYNHLVDFIVRLKDSK